MVGTETTPADSPTGANGTRRGVVLFAHGSRDPLWRAPIEAVETRLRLQNPDVEVRCAYLELIEPDLLAVAREMAARGVRQLSVVPMFLGTGKHAREDLPLLVHALRAEHPHLSITVQGAIGEDPRMTALMAAIASES
ncbi:sirohydrochlorin chelatase [Acidovorax sp. NCPPB 4044]|uniref:sirohydrochlorin chelatase n=1 Tax=Acidovorax sp. NCPPB 4044 TaxID=2940490 RepID=UPI002302F608|nr:CbiX/SirB N-terminal domain-containing protein [Acidovorax sp. NCPPB 4044]MDA8520676.1 CbiX/SirB N-terminal domain-containing protein [Acidovorax sp. NCPPB 4044]